MAHIGRCDGSPFEGLASTSGERRERASTGPGRDGSRADARSAAAERSHRGLVQRFAKPPSGVTCSEGSNPSLSASIVGARSSVDRAPACGAGGRGFESRRARQQPLMWRQRPARQAARHRHAPGARGQLPRRRSRGSRAAGRPLVASRLRAAHTPLARSVSGATASERCSTDAGTAAGPGPSRPPGSRRSGPGGRARRFGAEDDDDAGRLRVDRDDDQVRPVLARARRPSCRRRRSMRGRAGRARPRQRCAGACRRARPRCRRREALDVDEVAQRELEQVHAVDEGEVERSATASGVRPRRCASGSGAGEEVVAGRRGRGGRRRGSRP